MKQPSDDVRPVLDMSILSEFAITEQQAYSKIYCEHVNPELSNALAVLNKSPHLIRSQYSALAGVPLMNVDLYDVP